MMGGGRAEAGPRAGLRPFAVGAVLFRCRIYGWMGEGWMDGWADKTENE